MSLLNVGTVNATNSINLPAYTTAKPQHFNALPYRFTLALKFLSINK